MGTDELLSRIQVLKRSLATADRGQATGAQRAGHLLNELEEVLHKLAEYEAEPAPAEEKAFLDEIQWALDSSLDMDEAYEYLARRVRKAIPFDSMAVTVGDDEKDELHCAYATGAVTCNGQRCLSVPLVGTITHVIMQVRTGIIIDRTDGFASFARDARCLHADLKSLIAVPLVASGRAVGALHLGSFRPGAYSPRELALATGIGLRIAHAVAISWLQVELRREASEREALAEMGRILNATFDINKDLESFTAQVRKLVPFDRVNIGTVDMEQGLVKVLFSGGDVDFPGRLSGQSFPLAGTITEESIRDRVPIIVQADTPELLMAQRPGLAESARAGFASVLAVPLISENRVIGTLQFRSTLPRAYTRRHALLAETVATRLAEAITSAQLRLELQRQANEREVLAEIGRIMSSTLDIDEVYERFAEQARRLVPSDRVSIGVIDQDRCSLTIACVSGVDVPERRKGQVVPLSGTLAGEVMDAGAPVLVQASNAGDLEGSLPGMVPGFRAGLVSVLVAPLVSRGKSVGVLQFQSREPLAYTQRHLDLAMRIANQIVGAVANAALHSELQREVQERELLAEIGSIISSSLDIDEVYERFAEQVRKLIPFDRLAINLVHSHCGSYESVYMSGIKIPGRQRGKRLPLAGSFTGVVAEARSGMIVPSAQVDDWARRLPGLAPVVAAGIRSMMSVPLVSRGQVIGVMHWTAVQPDVYTTRHLELAERVAGQVAGAVANSQLYAALKQQAHEREVLAETGRIASSSLDIDDIYERFAEQVSRLIAFDRITIALPGEQDSDDYTLTFVQGVDVTARRREDAVPLAGTLTGEVVRRRSGVLVQDMPLEELSARFPGLLAGYEEGLRSFIAVPLISRDLVVGVLHLCSTSAGAYTERDLSLLGQIASQVAGAIANARLYAELRSAEESLRRSEAINRATLNAIPDLIMRHSRDGTYLACKQARDFETILPPDQLIGRKVHDVLPPHIADQRMRLIQQALSTGKVCTAEYRMAVGGELRDNEVRVVACGQDEVLVIVRDITERKRMEESLRRRTQQLEALMAVAGILASSGDFRDKTARVLDELSRVAQADRVVLRLYDDKSQALQLLGWTGAEGQKPPPPQASGKGLYGLAYNIGQTVVTNDYVAHPLAYPELVALGIRSMVSLPIRVQGRVRGVFSIGSRRPGHFSPELTRLLEGIADGMGALLENARLQQELTSRLEYDQRQLAAFRRAVSEFRFEDAPERTFHRMVHAARELVGARYGVLTTWDSQGKPENFVVSGLSDQERERMAVPSTRLDVLLDKIGGGSSCFRVDDVALYPDLHAFLPGYPQVRSFLGALVMFGGAPTGAFYLAGKEGGAEFSSDDERLLSFYATVAGVLLELQKQNDVRVQFLNVLCHELRLPITPILASAGMLQDLLGFDPKSIHGRLLNNIIAGAEALKARTDDLRDLGVFQAGSQQLELEEFDPIKALASVYDSLLPEALRRGQDLILEVPSRRLTLKADLARFKQVASNLVLNALKLTPEGKSVRMRAWFKGRMLVVEVEDQGRGISEAEQARLSLPYFRTEQDRIRFPGLGLGVALSRHIVEAHGGKLWLESTSSEGSVFRFSMPLHGPS